MAAMVGSLFGALFATYLVSRLFLRLLRPLGDTPWRILLADGFALAFAILAGAYGFASTGEGPQFTSAAIVYGPALVLWFIVDLVALKGRQGR